MPQRGNHDRHGSRQAQGPRADGLRSPARRMAAALSLARSEAGSAQSVDARRCVEDPRAGLWRPRRCDQAPSRRAGEDLGAKRRRDAQPRRPPKAGGEAGPRVARRDPHRDHCRRRL